MHAQARMQVYEFFSLDSTHTTLFDIPELSKAASVAHIFPSVGNLCDEGYSILFSISKVTFWIQSTIPFLKEAEI
jgi:hypothetical protein